ncbi:ATP-binding cassette domain-containing protein [uncultured Parolsenella sp.]|uniref:ABC transporter ATP-binding protein n=1 Tax=uncultured Parolsenella sp. TaxID=2083008 RepID=UPI0027D9923E|nr:ATP-binding cassette domain-containing protein [uncultured Parolsenella sp.]
MPRFSTHAEAATATPALSVQHLEKVYGGRTSRAAAGGRALTQALADVSFDVETGEFVGIMGASGSGKSTLLNCVSTIDAPTSGQVLVGGEDVSRLRGRALTRFRRDRLGFIFQGSNLLDTLTARENVALPLTIARVPAGEVLGRVEETASRLGIRGLLDKYPYQLSGGQQQRVAAARALVTKPTVVMADEPTGALDSKNARLLLEQLEQLNHDRAATILMVTHDGFAASYTGRVLFIRDGKIFTELRRGDSPRREFFDRIMEVVAMMGGEGSDAL